MREVFRHSTIKKVFLGLILAFSFTSTFSAVYLVNDPGDTDDLGPYGATNTLRKCIRLANADATYDEIHFNIPGPGPHLIIATTALPVITRPLLIDGLTQPGASPGNLLIEIDGAGDYVLQLGAEGGLSSSGSTIKGLTIYGANRGIYINVSSNNTISCNHIGTTVTGNSVAGALINWHGIQINNGFNNIIGGTGGANDRNIISGCNEDGIRISNNSTGTMVSGNYIGTDITGTLAIPNRQRGINCQNGSDNTVIGGNTVAHRNIISGNRQRGINIALSVNVLVKNNFIGTTESGNLALGNGEQGVFVENNSSNCHISDNVICSNGQQGVYVDISSGPVIQGNRIGLAFNGIDPLGNNSQGININNCFKPVIGGLTLPERNYISNNNHIGIRLFNADSVVIKGNYVGLNESGNADHGNNNDGIWMEQSDNPIVGGGELGARNYISGNNNNGLYINSSINPSVIDNYFGTGITGNDPIANNQTNINITNQSHNPKVINNIVCASVNGQGVFLLNSNYPIVTGNRIGLGLDGSTALGNRGHGLNIENALKPIIGGVTLVERNYISNNREIGIRLFNTDSVIIKGNYIGLNEAGNSDHGNNNIGIWMNQSDYAIIGGGQAGARNIISGNNQAGVHIEQSLQLTFVDNFVGTDISGNSAIGNNGVGVRIVNNSHDPLISNNVISANGQHGIAINNSERPVIKSNNIGLGLDATTVMGNNERGIELIRCINAQIGGVTVGDRNYIAANQQIGLYVGESSGSRIQGNYIGTDVSGTAAKGNGTHGMEINNSDAVLVGGAVYGARNIVVDSKKGHGIFFHGTSTNAIVKGNFVGVGADGGANDANPRLGNGVHGIFIGGDAHGALIGGSNAMERNVCSNNGWYLSPGIGAYRQGDGIRIEGPDKHLIIGNFCGVDSTGTKERGNVWAGISLNNCDSAVVGGRGPEEFNVCSGNFNEGMYLANSRYNKIIKNRVGTDVTGTLTIGNDDFGINIGPNGPNFVNILGGSVEDANIIAFTRGVNSEGPGVYVYNHSHRNNITYNNIFCNAGKAIQIVNPGNEAISPPTIEITYINTIQGTGEEGNIIHIYINEKTASDCNCEAEKFLGTAVVSGGKWTFNHNLNLSANDSRTLTATQTNVTNSTSELACSSTPCDLIINTQPKDTTVCMGNTAGFVVDASGSNLSFQWQENDGNGFKDIPGANDDTLVFPVNALAKNGFTYRAIVSINSFSNSLCEDTTGIVTLTVLPATSIASFSSDITICSGDPLNLGVTASGLNISYTWKFNDTQIGSNSNSYTKNPFTNADAGDYHVVVTGECGIVSSDTIHVDFAVQPDNDLTVTGSEICFGNDANVTIISAQAGVKYQAYIGSVSVSDITDGVDGDLPISIYASALQPGTNIISIHASGCGEVILTDTAAVVVLNNPGVISGPDYICSNATNNLIYSVSPVLGASKYEWYINGSLEITTTSNTATLNLSTLPSEIIVKPLTAGNHFCQTSAPIIVNAKPDYMGDDLILNEDTVCAGSSITFYLVNRTADTYSTWENGLPTGAELINKSDTSATVKFNTPGIFELTVQPYHSCESSINPLTASVVILPAPVANAGSDLIIDDYVSVILDGNGSSKGNIYGYEWNASPSANISTPDSIVTSAISQNLSTDYQLTVYTKNTASCKATDIVTVKVDFEEVFVPNIFSPNADGLHDYFEIENINFFPKCILYIYNQWGEQIFKSEPGYRQLWDGTRDGKPVPISTYYYVLELNEENFSNIAGQINIIR